MRKPLGPPMCRKIFRKTLAKILNQIQQKLCATPSAVTTTSGCGGLALASSIRRTPPGCWRGSKLMRVSSVPGRFTLPYLPGGLRKTAVPSRGGVSGALLSTFFDLFRVQNKTLKKRMVKKSTFSAIFTILGPPTSIF